MRGLGLTLTAAVALAPTADLNMMICRVRDDVAACLQDDSWPAIIEAQASCAPEEGSCLDTQQVQRLREQIARSVSSAHSADIYEGAGENTATAAGSAEQPIIKSSSADSNSARAAGHSGTGAPSQVKQKPRASGISNALARSNTGLTGAAREKAGQTAGTQEAEWQLTSLSRKALSSGRTKSSSLVQSITRLCLAISCCNSLLLL